VELAGGTAEAAKISFCRGSEAFAHYECLASPVLEGVWNEQQLAELLHATLSVKQWFIETDEFDKAERRLLNFGHTWGHALESATGFAIPHGLAVAIGMMASICFSGQEKHSSRLWNHCLALLKPVVSPKQLEAFDSERFVSAFRADKKHSSSHFHIILPANPSASGLGVKEMKLPADESILQSVLTAMRDSLHALGREIPSARTP
jgi:3-dehydroquinate synthase